jgi:hypothetical protein
MEHKMIWLDRIEQVARIGLWIALGAVVCIAPRTYLRQRSEEAQRVEAARKEDLARVAQAAKALEEAAKPARVGLGAFGLFLSAFNEITATGRAWLTNATGESVAACLKGTLTNPSSNETATSIVACRVLPPYASNVEVQLMFAGGEVARVCKGGGCAMRVVDVPNGPAREAPLRVPTRGLAPPRF